MGHGGQILLSESEAAHDLVKDRLPDPDGELRDMGERRLKDIVRPEHIYQVAVPDLPSDFPPLTTLETSRHNLPAQLTSFIGREGEIAEARELFASTRILTFIGPGGTGKTRLCLQVAAEQIPEFKEGVWLIELAQLADPSLYPFRHRIDVQPPRAPGRPADRHRHRLFARQAAAAHPG